MKNLTVNMPLAVPHQRPPSKYASHLYPAYAIDDYKSVGINAVGGSLMQIYSIHHMRDTYTSNVATNTSLLKQVFFNYNITADTEKYESNGVLPKSSLLQQTYFHTSFTIPHEQYNSKGISTKAGKLTQVYFLTKHTQPYEYYGSNGVLTKTSQLIKVA